MREYLKKSVDKNHKKHYNKDIRTKQNEKEMMKMNALDSRYGVVNATELVEMLTRLIAEHGDAQVTIGMTGDFEPVVRFGDIDVLE
jgi:hypothetical protein